MTKEQEIEEGLIRKLIELKYTYRPDIRDREAEVIELQVKKLNALKAHKKGLMQQLSPQDVR